MKHTESEYIKAGYDFEKGRKPAQSLRVMIEAEDIDDRAEARRLVEQGRAEARKQSRNSDGKKTMKNELFNVWADGQRSKTTVIATDMNEALDIFCARHGFVDHANYCREKQISDSNINIENVNH